MDGIFGVGPLEIILVVIIMLVLLGPKEMVVTSRKVGKFLRDLVKSPYWSEIMNTTREIRNLPTKLVRDSGIEEDIKEIQKTAKGSLDQINQMTQEAVNDVNQAVESTKTTWPQITPPPLPPPSPVASSPLAPIDPPQEEIQEPEPEEPVFDVFAAAGLSLEETGTTPAPEKTGNQSPAHENASEADPDAVIPETTVKEKTPDQAS